MIKQFKTLSCIKDSQKDFTKEGESRSKDSVLVSLQVLSLLKIHQEISLALNLRISFKLRTVALLGHILGFR